MFKLRKGLAVFAAITMLSTMSLSALAAPSASFQLGNQTFTASCSMGSTSGSGTSQFTTTAGLTVKVRYDYNYGPNQKYYDQAEAYSANGSTLVFATASAKSEHLNQNVVSVRVAGTHSVYYQNGSKTLYTNA